jgi:succinate dehydrogenase / fumarate reductase, cytochrome b subunit
MARHGPAFRSCPSLQSQVNNCCAFFRSSIGKKWIVAVTGGLMLLFVIAHLLGNLQLFLGPGDAETPAHINTYAKFLKGIAELLWIARIVLIIAVLAHVIATIKLSIENRAAKGGGARYKNRVQAAFSTRTMILSGTYILCFILFHLAHYTFFVVHPEYQNLHDAHGLHDVYAMLLIGFSHVGISIFYIIGMILLCMHLSHGIESMFQTLGLQTQRMRGVFRNGGRAIAILLAIGYISMPVAVLAGYGKAYREQAIAKANAQKEAR